MDSGPPDRIFHVPHNRNRFFVGRDDVLRQVRESLTREGKAAISQVQAISGLGGVGKTQTAIEYCYRHYYDRPDYQYVFWIRAETEQELKSELFETAQMLDMPFDEAAPDRVLLPLRNWFESNGDWLLIFDNADMPAQLVPYLPRTNRGHVLITSRAHVFDILGVVRPIDVPPLEGDEAVTFLVSRSGCANPSDQEKYAANELNNELGGLPLALEQAGAYILHVGLTCRRYLALYRSQGVALLEMKRAVTGDYHRDKHVPPSVATTWLVNFEQVARDSPVAADVLTLSGFLAPDAVPIWLICNTAAKVGQNIAGNVGSEADREHAIELAVATLAKYSLVRIDSDRRSYTMHRLVQRVVQQRLEADEAHGWIVRVVSAIESILSSPEFNIWARYKQLVPHALEVVSHAMRSQPIPSIAGRLCNRVGLFLSHSDQLAEAESALQCALDIGRATIGEVHSEYASWLNNLANVYKKQGRLAEAERLYRQAHELSAAASGDTRLESVCPLHNLVEVYRTQDRMVEAESLCRRIMEIIAAAVGMRHPTYAHSLEHLANVKQDLGQLAEAEQLMLQALEIMAAAVGEQSPDYASQLSRLTTVYMNKGMFTDAQQVIWRAMEITAAAVGNRHPSYASLLNNLAHQYQNQGKLADALSIFRQALKIVSDELGADHPSSGVLRENVEQLEREINDAK